MVFLSKIFKSGLVKTHESCWVFFTTVCNQLFAPWDLAQGASRRCSKKRNSNVFVVAMDIEPYKRSWTYRHTGTHTIFSMHGGLLAKIKSAGLLDCWIFLGMKDNAFAVKTNSWLCFKNTSNKRNYPVKSGLFHVSHLRIPERVSFQKM